MPLHDVLVYQAREHPTADHHCAPRTVPPLIRVQACLGRWDNRTRIEWIGRTSA